MTFKKPVSCFRATRGLLVTLDTGQNGSKSIDHGPKKNWCEDQGGISWSPWTQIFSSSKQNFMNHNTPTHGGGDSLWGSQAQTDVVSTGQKHSSASCPFAHSTSSTYTHTQLFCIGWSTSLIKNLAALPKCIGGLTGAAGFLAGGGGGLGVFFGAGFLAGSFFGVGFLAAACQTQRLKDIVVLLISSALASKWGRNLDKTTLWKSQVVNPRI